MGDDIIWAITKEEVQEIAQDVLNREITEDEMNRVSEEIRKQHNLLEMSGLIRTSTITPEEVARQVVEVITA